MSETEHMQGNHGVPAPSLVNLSEAIRWLLERHDECGADMIEQEDPAERQRRQHDLLLWLFNLEPRLTPYGESV